MSITPTTSKMIPITFLVIPNNYKYLLEQSSLIVACIYAYAPLVSLSKPE
jgi:hypothetical protein